MKPDHTSPQLERENPDPHESKNPLPPLYLVFFGAMGATGFLYLAEHRGADLGFGGDTRSVIAAPAELSGEAIFTTRCSSCHQPTGLGIPGVVPPLAGSPWLVNDGDTPVRIVLKGIQGKIEVSGTTYDGVMPQFEEQLDDESLAGVLTYARGAWGNQGAPVTALDVGRVRRSVANRTRPYRGGDELDAERTPSPVEGRP